MGSKQHFSTALRTMRWTRLWASVATMALALFLNACANRGPVDLGNVDPNLGGLGTGTGLGSGTGSGSGTGTGGGGGGTQSLADPVVVDEQNQTVAGFTPDDYSKTGFAVNVPQQAVFVPSMIREPSKLGLQVVNEFPQTHPIFVQNGVLRTAASSLNADTFGAVHFRHSLYDVYLGMQVAVPQNFSNAITVMARHHVTPSTYGTRPHCYVGCRLNTQLMRVELGEDIGGTWFVRGFRPMTSLTGTIELIAYKSNFGCYYNGQYVGTTYSKQFQENNERNALYGVNGQSFVASKAVVVNLFEASRRTEIPWFNDRFQRSAVGSPGNNYFSPFGTVFNVNNGSLSTSLYGPRVPLLLHGTGDMRSQDIRADVTVGALGAAGVVGHYASSRGGYASFIDCNGSCAIRSGVLNANGSFTEVQSVLFGGADYPNIGSTFQGRAKLRMTIVRNHSNAIQVNVYLNEQLALSWRSGYTWVSGSAGVYLQNGGVVNQFTVADHSQ